MRKFIACLLFCACALPALGQEADIAPAQFKGPRIVFDHHVVDVGVIERGTIKQIPFLITNKGDQPLRITAIELSCGCFNYTIKHRSVSPQSKTLLDVKLLSSILDGKFHKELYVRSNDPSAPRKTLAVKGFSRSSVRTKPSLFSFGAIARGESYTKSIKLYDMVDIGLRIKEITKSAPHIQVNFKPFGPSEDEEGAYKGKKGYLISVTIPPNCPLGGIKEFINVRTNLRVQPNVKISVLGEMVGDLRWEPSSVSLGIVNQDAGARQTLAVHSKSGDFRVSRVEHVEPFIDIVTYEKARGNYLVVIKVIPDSPRGMFKDEIRVFEEGSDKAVISVPVYGLVKGARVGHRPASKPKPSIPIKLKEGETPGETK